MANIIMTKSDWDYRGLAAECYDLWFGDEPFWDQAFFHDRIRRNGGVALEIACGTGRLLVPFLRDGLAVQGMDASDEMLAICRTKAANVGVTPTLYHQLMQDLDLAPRYHTLFIPACSFQILAEREEAFAALRRFFEHLEPGGELLITLMVPWRDFGLDRQWRLRRSRVRPSDGATILIHEATVSDRIEQIQHITMRHEVFKERSNPDPAADASVAVVPPTRVCHDAGVRGLPRGCSAVRIHRQRQGESRSRVDFHRQTVSSRFDPNGGWALAEPSTSTPSNNRLHRTASSRRAFLAPASGGR
jgi:SAM-dependent methyltransferase